MNPSFWNPNGYAIELRNCLQEAEDVVRRRNAESLVDLPRLIAAGKFVIVRHVPYFCRATDACAGELSRIFSVFDTYAEAERFLVHDMEHIVGEDERFEILPVTAPRFALVPSEPESGDEIPF